MKTVSVSIVIPVYNASRYILDTLQSVQNQTYEDWELILVDDGSMDNSVELMEKFIASLSSRARLLRHPNGANKGTSATRNLGLQSATGDFVCFLDADDIWAPGFLECFVDKICKNKHIIMVYCPCIYWYSDKSGSQGTSSETLDHVQSMGINSTGTIDSLTIFKLFLENENAVPSPSGVMMRRSAVVDVGGWEARFRGMCDDQVLYAKLLLQGGDVHVTEQPMYHYRQHDESLCRAVIKEGRIYESKKIYFTWLQEYLRQSSSACSPILKIINEQMALMEIRRQVDAQLDVSSSRLSAITKFIGILASLKDVQGTCYSYKVLRYGSGYFVAKLLRLNRMD